MARPSSLANVPVEALRAEIERRVSKLSGLLKLRDDVDRRIAELKALAGRFGQATPPAQPATPVRRKYRRKARRVTAVAKLIATPAVAEPVGKKKRGVFKQTSEQFLLGLLKDKTLTTSGLAAAWKKAGRGGTVHSNLSNLVKASKLKRSKLPVGKGSEYSLA